MFIQRNVEPNAIRRRYLPVDQWIIDFLYS
jgi:hypothetical protein